MPSTGADHVITALQQAGVQHLFGMPGGGSNADLVEAAGRAELPFTLAHTETASAFMASAQAEITGRPGACLATLGPGAASVMNGVANAHLDRIPLLVFTDCHNEAANVMQHQTLRQQAMFAPITRWSVRLNADDIQQTLATAIAKALGPLPGPVHLDLATEVSDAMVEGSPLSGIHTPNPIPPTRMPAIAERLLHGARRPLLLVGLGARTDAVSAELRSLCERHGMPALVTYKAKGVIPDSHPWFGGVLTHGALERPVLERADLFIAVGLDPVELLAKPWTYPQAIISLNPWPLDQQQLHFAAEGNGDVVDGLQSISNDLAPQCEWDVDWLRRTVAAQREDMQVAGRPALLSPYRVVELVAQAYPQARVTVDAGAHMFPALALWPVPKPNGLLISNGLATMGFALPAAIGTALIDRAQPTVALTGDGGLLMCTGELRTAARERIPLRIIVFDDSSLSLIKIKQVQRGYRTDGVTIGDIGWRALGEAMGMPAYQVRSEDTLMQCLSDTAHAEGPVLIAASIDPEPYRATIRALRG